MSNPRLEGKVALITGGTSGIGEAAARLFAEHGAAVVVADIPDELGRQVIASINSDKVSHRHCDVTNEEQVAAAVGEYGGLDILFSNAGALGSITSILDLDIRVLDKVLVDIQLDSCLSK